MDLVVAVRVQKMPVPNAAAASGRSCLWAVWGRNFKLWQIPHLGSQPWKHHYHEGRDPQTEVYKNTNRYASVCSAC